ncbi:uncharacterized protein LOC119835631 [Zerene cesonia]|uniref:uncharacterized protein LOC119835631 n=1 Tax=Zerene cesonia TaxID=33412 RepID=UPI0018E506C4|nr:uncharacterized protein LOC119835631 [Zerene cesonia]
MSEPTDLLEPEDSLKDTKSNDTPLRKQKIEDYFVRDGKKNQLSRSVQVNLDAISLKDDVALRIQSNNYWYIQAEEKRKELESALKENERLCQLKATLKEENLYYKQMLDEVQSFMDVYKEVTDDAGNDTGIDLGASDESQNISC